MKTIYDSEVIRSMAKFIPHNYQKHAIGKVIENPACGLFLDMGLRQDNYYFNSSPGINARSF